MEVEDEEGDAVDQSWEGVVLGERIGTKSAEIEININSISILLEKTRVMSGT